jgi:arylsulfatase
LPEPIGPQLFPRAHTIAAEIIVPESSPEGVIACVGAFSAGWSLYVEDGKPFFRYTFFDIADVTIPGSDKLPSGKVTVSTRFQPDGTRVGSGTLELMVNQKLVGQGKITRSAFRHGLEPFEIGRDSITPVCPDYRGKGDFPFNGKIEKVFFSLTK